MKKIDIAKKIAKRLFDNGCLECDNEQMQEVVSTIYKALDDYVLVEGVVIDD